MIEKGQIFLLSSGQYSDYSVETVCRAIADFDMGEITREYRAEYPDEERYNNLEAFLINVKKVAEEIDFIEIHRDFWEGEITVQKKGWDILEEYTMPEAIEETEYFCAYCGAKSLYHYPRSGQYQCHKCFKWNRIKCP